MPRSAWTDGRRLRPELPIGGFGLRETDVVSPQSPDDAGRHQLLCDLHVGTAWGRPDRIGHKQGVTSCVAVDQPGIALAQPACETRCLGNGRAALHLPTIVVSGNGSRVAFEGHVVEVRGDSATEMRPLRSSSAKEYATLTRSHLPQVGRSGGRGRGQGRTVRLTSPSTPGAKRTATGYALVMPVTVPRRPRTQARRRG